MNPLNNENKIWERIKSENITVDRDIWGLINHYMRNALGMISSGWQELNFNPMWVLKAQSVMITVLGKMATPKGATPQEIKIMVDIIQEIAQEGNKIDPDKIIKMCDEAFDWDNDTSVVDLLKFCDRGIRLTKEADNFLRKLHEATEVKEQEK